MRERDFIRQKHDKWEELESFLNEKSTDPDQIANLFIQTTEDLSFSRTYYKNRSVRVYLNLLANKIFALILKQKKGGIKAQFVNFWKEELPYVLWSVRKDLLISFLFFIMAVGIGVFSSMTHDTFINEVLGDGYVSMTQDNIDKGDPMAVYKKMHQVDMFLGITYNNLRVAFLTFVSGIFAALGSLLVMLNNGIMLGSFQYYFIEKGLFWESFLAVWLHGTIEISCIIIAGAAGITLGKGWIFPGTYSRLQSLQIAANKSIKIMISITPLIVLAGIIESFLTRYTDAPDFVRLGLIIFSFLLILFVFVITPLRKGKTLQEKYQNAIVPVNSTATNERISIGELKGNGQIITESLTVFLARFGKILGFVFLISLTFSASLIWKLYLDENLNTKLNVNSIFSGIFDYSGSMVMPITGVNAFFLLLFLSFGQLKKRFALAENTSVISTRAKIVWMLFASLFVNLSFFIPNGFWSFVVFVSMSMLLFIWGTSILVDGKTIREGWSQSLEVLKIGFWKIIGLNTALVLLVIFILGVVSSPIVYFYLEVININIPFEGTTRAVIMNTSFIALCMTITMLLVPIIIIANTIIYYSVLEQKYASHLLAKIDEVFVNKKRVFGMEAES